MTVGAVIFAQNNNRIDYVKLAIHSALRVKEHLNIPVSLITENKDYLLSTYPDHPFDQIVDIAFQEPSQVKNFYDGTLVSKKLVWKNSSRSNVYDLTPYDKTLVIDSDFLINSPLLLSAINNDNDFQIYRKSMDLASYRDTSDFQRINQYSVPFYWATVFIFQKSAVMESFFNMIEYIRDNWFYFKVLYNVNSNTFRNDIAFSIAIHIMNGKTNGEFATDLPGSLVYCTDRDFLVGTDGKKMKFLIEKQNHLGEYTLVKTTGLDVHVMNKYSLSRYIDGGSGV